MNTNIKTEIQDSGNNEAKSNKQRLKEMARNLSEDLPLEALNKMLLDANKELHKRLNSGKTKGLKLIVETVKKYNISLDEITKALAEKDALFKTNDALKGRNMYLDKASGAFWNGIGRKPKWLIEHENAGTDIQQFVVGSDQLSTLTPHFYNPKKPQQRWNGYGRKPDWFIKLQEKNINTDSFVIYL